MDLAGTRRMPLQKIVSRPSRGGRDDSSPTKHERIVDDVGRVRGAAHARLGFAAREALRAIDRHDRRRLAHPSEAGVGRRLRVEMQDVERSAFEFQARDSTPGQQTDVQLLAPAPQIDVCRQAAARREPKAEHAASCTIRPAQLAAQVDVHGVDAGKQCGHVAKEPAHGPVPEDPRIEEQHAPRRVRHEASSPRSSRCRTAFGAIGARRQPGSAGQSTACGPGGYSRLRRPRGRWPQ